MRVLLFLNNANGDYVPKDMTTDELDRLQERLDGDYPTFECGLGLYQITDIVVNDDLPYLISYKEYTDRNKPTPKPRVRKSTSTKKDIKD